MVKTEDFGFEKKIVITEGEYSAAVITRGAILQSFKCGETDIVLGYDNLDQYISGRGHLGEVIGPFANRIANARYEDVVLEANNGPNSLHSGSKNYGDKHWDIKEEGDAWVTLSLVSVSAGGFPTTEKVLVTYTLTSCGALTLSYKLESDARLPVNLTNHAYFNLNGDGSDVRKDHYAFIPANHYLVGDQYMLAKEVAETKGSDFDFTSSRLIGSQRNGVFDNCFVLDGEGATTVENDKFSFTCETDLPAVHFYTAGSLGPVKGKGGAEYVSHSAFCLETEFYPDFPNRPEFPQNWAEKGKTIECHTTYTLRRK